MPDGGGGLAIWSRYPLHPEHNYPGFELGVLRAVVDAPSGPVTLYAVHLLPPYPYPSGEWIRELARLRALLDATGGSRPVVVGGDFNATVDQAPFRRLLGHGYRDAAEQLGAGYLATYPTDHPPLPPVIAIDHLLLRDASPVSLRTVALPKSDHRGLLVRVALDA